MRMQASIQGLEPLIGHALAVTQVAEAVEQKRGVHAYLFVGPGGVGKTAAVGHLAARLVCLEDSRPCGTCATCRQAASFAHPDVTWVRPETDERTGKLRRQVSVDQIRELLSQVSHTSMYGRYRVAIITDAEGLAEGASNALLKTLEEPPADVIFLLTARHHHLLPQTLTSRCQVVRLHPLPISTLSQLLQERGLPKPEAARLSAWAGGLPSLAWRLAQDPEEQNARRQSVELFLELMAATPSGRLPKVAELAASAQTAEDEVASVRLERWMGEWSVVLRDLLLVTLGQSSRIRSTFALPAIQQVAQSYSPGQIVALANQLERSRSYLAANANLRLVLEQLFLAPVSSSAA